MIGHRMTVHMTEAEVARDLHAVLTKGQQGAEVVIEQNHRPVAVIKQTRPDGRMIPAVLANLKARGSNAVIDDDFARDIEHGIKLHREPWNPPSCE